MVSDLTLQTAIEQQSQTTAAQQSLATDFSEFLQLLTVQLQNQDPLSPMDSTEFTNQLVAFTGVEQQINTNQKLDDLIGLNLSDSLSSAQNYVGQNISYISSEFNFDGSPAEIRYSLPRSAADATIRILNEEGGIVYEESISGNAGASDFVWDGRQIGGGIAPDGTYEVQIDAIDSTDEPIQATTVVSGEVRGVESQNGQIFLLVGERAVALGNVLNTSTGTNVEDPSTAISSALEYIGLDVTYQNDKIIKRNGEDPTITYSLPEDANRAKILIYDDQGNLVFSDDISTNAGDASYTWDSDSFPAGEYRFSIDAIADSTNLIKRQTVSYSGSDDFDVNYTLPQSADEITINIYDSSTGQLIRSDSGATRSGVNTYSWDGKTDTGADALAGNYSIEVVSTNDTDERIPVASTVQGRVTGVESDNGVVFLQIGPTTSVPLTEIRSVSVPTDTGGA